MERDKPYRADSRGYFRVVGSNIVRPIAFMEQQIVTDTPKLEQKRLANQNRVKHGKYPELRFERSGNQIVYDALNKATRQGKGFGSNGRPRGYSASNTEWNTINRANSTKGKGQ